MVLSPLLGVFDQFDALIPADGYWENHPWKQYRILYGQDGKFAGNFHFIALVFFLLSKTTARNSGVPSTLSSSFIKSKKVSFCLNISFRIIQGLCQTANIHEKLKQLTLNSLYFPFSVSISAILTHTKKTKGDTKLSFAIVV